ncbi:hypothetical protein C0J52_10687 [Blattella germanica]|nr:hypothetical protein C0J52_10687 [Blattella germanica]
MEATVTKITRGKKLLNNQRTESSADSDYSFESHASSSLESRSPRELEENCDMILELPSWLRSPATAPVVAGNSPSSSMSQSPEECENAAASQPSTLAPK